MPSCRPVVADRITHYPTYVAPDNIKNGRSPQSRPGTSVWILRSVSTSIDGAVLSRYCRRGCSAAQSSSETPGISTGVAGPSLGRPVNIGCHRQTRVAVRSRDAVESPFACRMRDPRARAFSSFALRFATGSLERACRQRDVCEESCVCDVVCRCTLTPAIDTAVSSCGRNASRCSRSRACSTTAWFLRCLCIGCWCVGHVACPPARHDRTSAVRVWPGGRIGNVSW